uniref:Uncharacterized protein n=1 Tax=Cucumis melo TaxID=3656 RepID=A0A9I9E9E0_CUCME
MIRNHFSLFVMPLMKACMKRANPIEGYSITGM